MIRSTDDKDRILIVMSIYEHTHIFESFLQFPSTKQIRLLTTWYYSIRHSLNDRKLGQTQNHVDTRTNS